MDGTLARAADLPGEDGLLDTRAVKAILGREPHPLTVFGEVRGNITLPMTFLPSHGIMNIGLNVVLPRVERLRGLGFDLDTIYGKGGWRKGDNGVIQIEASVLCDQEQFIQMTQGLAAQIRERTGILVIAGHDPGENILYLARPVEGSNVIAREKTGEDGSVSLTWGKLPPEAPFRKLRISLEGFAPHVDCISGGISWRVPGA